MNKQPAEWAWSDFQRADVHAHAHAHATVRLPRHGWFALVAFLAGPRSVHAVAEQRRPVRWSSSNGDRGTRPHTPDELDELESELAAYLALAGIEPPPRTIEWRLTLRSGVSEEQFWERVHARFDPVDYDRPGGGHLAASRLRNELASLVG